MWGYADELCAELHNNHIITSSEDEFIMNIPRSHRTQLLLTKLAMKFRSGNITLYDRILKMFKTDANIQELFTKMKEKFKALKFTGMCMTWS